MLSHSVYGWSWSLLPPDTGLVAVAGGRCAHCVSTHRVVHIFLFFLFFWTVFHIGVSSVLAGCGSEHCSSSVRSRKRVCVYIV